MHGGPIELLRAMRGQPGLWLSSVGLRLPSVDLSIAVTTVKNHHMNIGIYKNLGYDAQLYRVLFSIVPPVGESV